ncbi:argininosuccinate lyase [Thermoproteota archaeon]
MSPDILRGRRLKKLNPESVKYTASTDFDDILVNPVITINKAHMVMLVSQGVVKKTQGAKCLVGLNDINPKNILDPNLEDVHMNVEFQLIEKVGMDVGGQLNLAKSRNDQVSTAIRMALRSYLLEIMSNLSDLQLVILSKAKENLETIMPSYTHLQHAQPTTLAHHLMAYHNSLQRDSERLVDAYDRLNLNPLGSAALASTSIKIDRELTTHLLGFDGLVENSMDAVSSRDFAIEIISNLVLNMTNLSRIAEELVLWSSTEFSILEISDSYASTSSIMPQKKNAVVAELLRGKTSTVYGDMMAAVSIMKSLPYSYNIDMQQLTPHIWSSCEITLTSIKEMKGMIEEAAFNVDRLANT